MKLFNGVHEIRLFRPSGTAVGYFDDFDAALRAVESEPTQYKAAYFTLNPIKLPATIPVNPQALIPSRNAAGAADIERRIWLLVDLDPPRPAGVNATEAEKQGAREQADSAREYLRSRNWPELMLCDSGNGWHLLYRIELANDDGATELVRGVLARLHQLFPMVDAGNFDAPRLCKLYGSWARKGEHTDERPWRQSAIVEEGSDTIVTEQQLCALMPAPVTVKIGANNVKLASLIGFLDYYGAALRSEPREVPGGWQIEIECPWIAEHSDETRRDTVVSFIAGLGFGFKYFHSHCANRHWRDLKEELAKRNPGLTPYFGKLPPMTNSDIACAFVESHDDFVRLHDRETVTTGVWIPGARWALGDPGDTLLRGAIRQYLNELFDLYPTPEPGRKDYRLVLKQATFLSGVLAEVKPKLPTKRSTDFDADPFILPLPNGKVADMGADDCIRGMLREDCQTKRIPSMPADVPTPRFDRFRREITCGDDELADYLLRIMVLCILGQAPHLLIFFYGSGRNGKGVLLRLVEKILGRELFAVALRPEEVEYRRGANDRDKRTMGRLRGMRLAYTGETVNGPLDWTLLKLLSGGDTLAGAKLYVNTEGFAPSHTLILTTNDRPVLPPTVAFKERLRFVPFNGHFGKSKDFTLEADLEREIPGILWQLIKAAPGVIANGDEPPPAVLEATADLLEENDLGAPFIEANLEDYPDAITPLSDIEERIRQSLGGLVIGSDERVDRIMASVRARWNYKRRGLRGHRVCGLIGVRLIPSS